jgi:hypothetical protein
MKRLAWLFVVIAMTLGDGVTAQLRPDFSGTWTAPGSSLTIRHAGTTLTVIEGTETRNYNLDGSDRPVERIGRADSSKMTAQARWVGSALVIATTTVSSIGTWQDLEVYSMDYGPKLSVVQVGTQTTSTLMYTVTKTYDKK